MWCKHTNYEQATRAPLILIAPGKKRGSHTRAIVEFVDLYPTLCELAGIEKRAHLQGVSLAPLLDSPDAGGKRAAFQVYPRQTPATGPMLGHAVRSDRWRYVEWRTADQSVAARELYDMEKDADETVNLAGKAEFAAAVREHADMLTERLGAIPPAGLRLVDLSR
jgi:arylsulfatase A-like enzyme